MAAGHWKGKTAANAARSRTRLGEERGRQGRNRRERGAFARTCGQWLRITDGALMGRRGLALRCNIESRGHNAKLDAGSVLRPRTLCWGVGGGMVVLERVVSVKACRAFHPCDPVGEAGWGGALGFSWSRGRGPEPASPHLWPRCPQGERSWRPYL